MNKTNQQSYSAYAVMPEHAHVLIWPTQSNYFVSEILNSIKQSVAKRAIAYARRKSPSFLPQMEDRQPSGKTHHRFWQRGGGYDRNIIELETAYNETEYIHANPVRRRLCQRPEDWYWSSAADYAKLRSGPLSINLESLYSSGFLQVDC